MELKEPAVAYAQQKFTIGEYLLMERSTSQKHEYYMGEIFAMTGASARHDVLLSNLIGKLASRLNGPCRPYGSDLRIHIPENSLFTYPYTSIICRDLVTLDEYNDTAIPYPWY